MNEKFLKDLHILYRDIVYLEAYDMTYNDWGITLNELQLSLDAVDSFFNKDFNRFIREIDIKDDNPLFMKYLKVFHNEFMRYHNINLKDDISLNSIIVDFDDLEDAIIDILDALDM